jgi:RNA polymerase sigma-70 factor, ECF subfamily
MSRSLLEAARAGDEDAFRRLVDPHRGELEAHCRRMLTGCPGEAEDVMQEVLLRAWRALGRFEGRASLRAWLYRIATNACLNAIEKRRRTVLPVDYEPTDDVCAVHGACHEDVAEHRAQIEAALRTAVEDLPPSQRAALILRDVVGFSARESAATLATTTTSVNSALQRARAKLATSASATPRRPADERVASLVAALERDDVATVVAIAADAMPSRDRAWTFSPVPAY